WLTRAEFLDLLGATNLIPGPNSTELAIHIGHRRAGWPGLLVAGACFIVPAMLIVLALAWAYVRFGRLPEAAGLLYGVKPVVIAIVLQALLGLARAAVKSPTLGVAGAAAVAATAAGVHELVVLGAVGMAIALLGWAGERTSPGRSAPSVGPLAAPIAAACVATGAAAFGLGPLFLFFLKVGSVLFGSGYVLLAFLRAALVGVAGASLALMAVVTWQLGRSALVDLRTVTLAVVSGVLLLRYRINSAWLVLAGAAVGILTSL